MKNIYRSINPVPCRKMIQAGFGSKIIHQVLFALVVFLFCIGTQPINAQTPLASNGKLSVSGTNLVNKNGVAVQLRGMSSHGLQWFTEDYNFNSLSVMVNNWGIDVFRLAMYPTDKPDATRSAYEGNPAFWRGYVDNLVDVSGNLGIYCIIDWHVLTPGDPTDPAYFQMAKDFWDYMSKKHAGKDQVLYEICNEPNGTSWATVKAYANAIIPIIRANDPTSIIIVGSPTWSSDVDVAANDPIKNPLDPTKLASNVMYSFHFYAATHGQNYRDKITTAISKGLAIFATEWGSTSASGDGASNWVETQNWMDFLNTNKISWCNWSYCDKLETSAVLVAGSGASLLWNNTSAQGDKLKSYIATPADSWVSSGNWKPTANISSPLNGDYILPGTTLNLSVDASDKEGNITSVDFYVDGAKIGSATTAPYIVQWIPTTVKDYLVTAVANDNAGASGASTTNTYHVVASITQTAYPSGTPWPVPGDISCINFDNGGEMIAYHDLDAVHKGPATGNARQNEGVDVEGTNNVGYPLTGEWLEYTVNVTQGGIYDFTINCASGLPGVGKFHLESNGVAVTPVVDIPSSGNWGSYQPNIVHDVSLKSGQQVIRLYINRGGFNFSTMNFKFIHGGTTVTDVSVSPASTTVGVNKSTTLTAVIEPSTAINKSVTWKSSNTSVATVNSMGVVTGVSVGTATITVTTVDQGLTATSEISVEIPVPVTGVNVAPSNATLFVGTTTTLIPTILPANATDKAVTWKSSNTAVATVNASGVVTGIALGNATITVTTVDQLKTATSEITVEPLGENLALNKPATSSSLENGGFVNANVNDGNPGTRWASLFTDPQWVSIDLLQLYTIKKVVLNWEAAAALNYEIQVSTDGANWQSIYTTTTGAGGIEQIGVNGTGRYIRMYGTARTTPYGYSLYEFEVYGTAGVIVPVTGVTVAPISASLFVNETRQLTATVLPTNATNKNVTWGTSNPNIATVNASGFVTAIAEGTAGITAKSVDGNFTASTAITVSNIPVTSISVTPASATINGIGGTTALTATILPANATNKSVTWSSSNPLVATVSQSGIVTGVALGTATITATTVSGGFMASSAISVTIVIVPVESVTLSPISGNVIIGNNIQLTPNVLPVNATNKAVSYVSSNPLLATVSSTGLVTGVAEGNVTITVTTLDGVKTATSSITILAPSVPKTIAVTPTSVTLDMGSTQQFTAIVRDQYGAIMVISPIWSATGGTISTTGLYTASAKGDFVVTAQSGSISGSALVKVNDVPFYAKIEAESYTAMLGIQTETTTDIGGGKNVGWINNGDWMTYSVTVPQAGIYAANFRVAGWQATGKIELQNYANVKLTSVNIPNNGGYQKWSTVPGDNNFNLLAGTQTIRIYAAGAPWNLNWFEIKSVAISVLTTIDVTPNPITLTSGISQQFTAVGRDQNGAIMPFVPLWSATGGSISSTGLYTAGNTSGVFAVTAASGNVTGSSDVIVVGPIVPTSVSVIPASLNLGIGSSSTLTAEVLPVNATNKSVSWLSSNPLIATVNSAGVVTGLAEGSAIITATTVSGGLTATSAITVATIPVTGVTVSPTILSVNVGSTSFLTATVLPANATNKNVSWTSSNPTVATVSSTGVVSGITTGSAIITVTTVSGGFTASSAVTITPVAVTGVVVSPTTLNINIGSTSPLAATVSPANATNKSVSWLSSNPAIATVSSSGVVSGVTAGSAIITVTTVNGGFTASCAVTVTDPNNCTFGTPIATALPTISNKSFSHAYVVGTGGPNLSNVTNFTINWDLANNGLWQFSMNTNNGTPGWWIDLLPKITKSFNVASPSCKITGSGIAGLDNDYWVNYDGTIFVLVAKSGKYAVVGSNSATPPAGCPTMKQAGFDLTGANTPIIYPNPIDKDASIILNLRTEAIDASFTITDLSGKIVLSDRLTNNENSISITGKLNSGLYFVRIQNGNEHFIEKLIVK
jgi:uncharacterized protein YjdB